MVLGMLFRNKFNGKIGMLSPPQIPTFNFMKLTMASIAEPMTPFAIAGMFLRSFTKHADSMLLLLSKLSSHDAVPAGGRGSFIIPDYCWSGKATH